ncbi:MAG: glycosyltransferase [Deltaproteobacteria bacterium]|nr:glycosyltransferase [Deltaproteobacteria bacterium]
MIRAVLFGTYTAVHPANRLLAAAFRAAGIALDVCHEPLWERTRDKHARFFGARSLARLGLAYVGAAVRLRRRFRAMPPPDLVVTGFNGQLDVLLARVVAGRRARLVFAPLVTLTETLVDDRRVYRRGGLKSRAARRLDRWTLERPDLVLMDTETHRTWIAERLAPRARTATLYLGAEPAFRPTPARARGPGEPLRVLFYGQYVPLHGTQVIVEAAARLGREGGVALTMIGSGPERAAAMRLAAVRGVGALEIVDWIEYAELPARLAACDVALGIFGTTSKARMVIPTKVYQAAACGRAVVTADTPALREVFTPGEDVLTVRPGDAGALAAMLRRLRDTPDLAPRIGAAAGRLLAEHLDAGAQGARLATVLAAAFPDLGARLAASEAAPLAPALAGAPVA